VSLDGRALRQHWDTTCDGAADVVRRHIPLAQERGDTDVASYLRAALGRLVRRRLRPMSTVRGSARRNP
jgi:hypothetical protein